MLWVKNIFMFNGKEFKFEDNKWHSIVETGTVLFIDGKEIKDVV